MNRWLSIFLLVIILATTVSPVAAQDTSYVVQQGDTLLKIAVRFGTSIAAIKLANGLVSDLIFIGQTLKIPTTTAPVAATPSASNCPQSYTVTSGDTLKIIAARCGVDLATLIAANRLINPDLIFVGQTLLIPAGQVSNSSNVGQVGNLPNTTSPCGVSYTVQRGDYLNLIADKCKVAVASLITTNNIVNTNLIFVGQVLIMPGAAITVAPQTTALPTASPNRSATATPTTVLSPLIIGGVATATPAPSSIVGASPVNAARGITGELSLCNPEKPTFATKIERICFRMKITNTTSSKINYSILGVQATNLSGGANQFQSSWKGDLSVEANSVGPTSGGWEDGIYIQNPGTYALQVAICYAITESCFIGTGWEILTPGAKVTAIVWIP
ncbi:MAG: LysM peptidoglycan-binding domain-containing protein [Chloroflexi bacterium]|nr:LysM peptidoglycan-binding domain-containing protein [Chloroflexota bacterium]